MDEKSSALVERSAAWLADLEAALSAQDASSLTGLFLSDAYWRDLVAFTWDAQQFYGVDAIVNELMGQVDGVKPTGFELDPTKPEPRSGLLAGVATVDVFFRFETSAGRARGIAFLHPDESSASGLKAFLFHTALSDLAAAGSPSDGDRHPGLGFEREWPGQTWAEYRTRRVAYEDRDPEILVVGGAHAGVCLSAQLQQMGADVLIVDRHQRAGDSWRTRYESLALHTPTSMSDFPFMPFPAVFPEYLPKDKVADWIESYVRLMDLNYWTATEFLGAEFDENSLTWTARLRRDDGSTRILHPKHVVMAIGGVGTTPRRPDLPGLDSFAGTLVHSADFHTAREHRGVKALVVGTGTSSHDIALDLYHHGADVTMLQRGSTSVVDVDVANVVYGDYTAGSTMPRDEADLRSNAKFILPLLTRELKKYTEWTQDENRELHADLERIGMQLDTGEDGTGWPMKFYRHAGGYYLNVGASDVIVDGGIKIEQYDAFDRFSARGIVMKDGTEREYDLVVLATGYELLTTEVRAIFGGEVADRVGAIGGLGEDGERVNFCKPTKQPHLWFIFGGMSDGRRSTSWLALQIQAQNLGVVPTFVRGVDGRLTEFSRSLH